MNEYKKFTTELAKAEPWNEGAPKINAPRIFGAGINSPFFFPIPVTGERPLTFSVEGRPEGLSINSETGIISGAVRETIEITVNIKVSNCLGNDEQECRIVTGDKISLTPPLGWNSWNVWGSTIDEKKIKDCADNMIASGLAAHGFSYINIDDGWQGERSGPLNALQANNKFKDMKALCDYIHSLGLRAGIYSTPWVKSYGGYNGGSSGECVRGESEHIHKENGWYFGEHTHHGEDARQWAEWGIDYLKYDWSPWEVHDIEVMHDALENCGRDIIYSLSNSAPFDKTEGRRHLANCRRTTGDITDTWQSVCSIGFSQDKWIPYSGQGHWNDPDMLVVGKLGWGKVRENRLTHDEQITHITLWAILAAPMLLGCDLTQIDEFTVNLMSNNEMLAVNQDPMGRQGHCVRELRRTDENGQITTHENVYVRELYDGSLAVGLFNRADIPAIIEVSQSELGIGQNRQIRDIWAKRNIGIFDEKFSIGVPAHGAQFVRIKQPTAATKKRGPANADVESSFRV